VKAEVEIITKKELSFSKVTYYSLKFEGEKQTELEKFYERYQETYSESVYYLKFWIAEIGEKFGANTRYFRPEDNAFALPPPSKELQYIDFATPKKDMSLRLYCIVLSPEIVILVDGGIKESDATRDSPSCWKSFMVASNIASQIKQMITLGNLQIKGKTLKRSNSFKLTYNK